MNKKLILVITILVLIFTAACSGKSNGNLSETKSSNTAADKSSSSKVQDVKKQDDKIIQEAIDTMDDLKLDEINDGILDDSELDSILKDKDDPIGDIPTK
ncbi:MAG: hypothetical protein LIR50_04255 [Bacillota bacterium]|nr:hypothetical protein [Bacillota bacterium]